MVVISRYKSTVIWQCADDGDDGDEEIMMIAINHEGTDEVMIMIVRIMTINTNFIFQELTQMIQRWCKLGAWRKFRVEPSPLCVGEIWGALLLWFMASNEMMMMLKLWAW